MYYVVKIEYGKSETQGEYLITISNTKTRTLVAEQTICDCGIAFPKPAKTEVGDIVALTPENLGIQDSLTIKFVDYNTLKVKLIDLFHIERIPEVAHSLYYLLKDGECQDLHGPC
ncbi:hypothetical protein ACO0LB_20420 [Undibacterium sp. SXout7W]|uniref:hypothetical protein n=1 Tax=Undibacterium sp. SXout7W TaxID=3413049 RepID=UPI003BF3A129